LKEKYFSSQQILSKIQTTNKVAHFKKEGMNSLQKIIGKASVDEVSGLLIFHFNSSGHSKRLKLPLYIWFNRSKKWPK